MDFQELNDKLQNFDVNDIDWNNMGSWPLVGRAIFAAIIFVAILIGLYMANIQGLISDYDRVVEREGSLKTEFESKAFRVANLGAYKKQLSEIEESFGSLLRQLPRDTEVPGLLEDITGAATGAGLEIVEIKLEDEVETEFYTELPIKVNVIGEYHDFGAFVSVVAGLGRIVTLHDFEVESAKDASDENKLNLKIVAKTYRYNDELKKKKKKKKRKK